MQLKEETEKVLSFLILSLIELLNSTILCSCIFANKAVLNVQAGVLSFPNKSGTNSLNAKNGRREWVKRNPNEEHRFGEQAATGASFAFATGRQQVRKKSVFSVAERR